VDAVIIEQVQHHRDLAERVDSRSVEVAVELAICVPADGLRSKVWLVRDRNDQRQRHAAHSTR
jgi:hypothetical protein